MKTCEGPGCNWPVPLNEDYCGDCFENQIDIGRPVFTGFDPAKHVEPLAFDWRPTGRKNGLALPDDAFDDVWAITYRDGSGWVIIKNREQLPWLFYKSAEDAKRVVETSIKGLLNDESQSL